MKRYNVAVVGALGAVGQEMIKILEERKFPVKNLIPLDTPTNVGKYVDFKGDKVQVEIAQEGSFLDVDIASFSAAGEASLALAPIAVKEKAIVIDNSNAWRMDKNVPLVIPEVNPEDLDWHKGIIANPNCSTIQLLVALKPIHDAFVIKRVVVSTYQAVSGAGERGIDELLTQFNDFISGDEIKPQIFQHQIALNALPQIDVFLENSYTKEEMKIVNETHKILDEKILVSATAVRVPVIRCHSESVNIETEKEMNIEAVIKLFEDAKGVKLIDDISKNSYPLPIVIQGTDDVAVGRIRKDNTLTNGLNMWIVADNLRKGAALNTVQIGETLVNRKLV